MTAKLTKELAEALRAASDGKLEVVDPETERTYVLVDSEMHRQEQDRDAIAQGIAEMEAGAGIPVNEARLLTRQTLARGQ